MDDKKAEPHPSGFVVLTPRGVQQWEGDSTGSAARAPDAPRSLSGEVGDDQVRMSRDFEGEAGTMPSALPDHREDDPEEGDQERGISQRIIYKIPSTFNLGQTLLWICTSISGHLSRQHLEREIERWWSYNPKAEPPLSLVASRLSYAHLDPLSADQHPTLSAGVAFQEAGDQILDALRSGRLKMWGEPSDPRNNAEFLSAFQCEQIRFSEGQYGAARAVTVNKPERFWTCLRFTSSEIMDLWPVPDIVTIENGLEEADALVQQAEAAIEVESHDKVEQSATIPQRPLPTTEANPAEGHPVPDATSNMGESEKNGVLSKKVASPIYISKIIASFPTDPRLKENEIITRVQKELDAAGLFASWRSIYKLRKTYRASRDRGEHDAALASRKSDISDRAKSDTK